MLFEKESVLFWLGVNAFNILYTCKLKLTKKPNKKPKRLGIDLNKKIKKSGELVSSTYSR